MANLNAQLHNLLNHDEFDQFVGLINQNPGCGDQLNLIIENDTLLHRAIRYAKINYVRALVQNGASMNVRRGIDGFDALFQAVYMCAVGCSRFEDIQDDKSKMDAVKKIIEYCHIVVYLLESGADPNTVDSNGDPLLILLCSRRYDNKIKHVIKRIVTVLIDHNIDVNTKTVYNGYTIEFICILTPNHDLLDHIQDYQPVMITKGVNCDGGNM